MSAALTIFASFIPFHVLPQKNRQLSPTLWETNVSNCAVFNFQGLRLVGTEYQWQDGSKLQYSQWSLGEPTGGGEYLTILNAEGFADVPESHGSAIFCEKGIHMEA